MLNNTFQPFPQPNYDTMSLTYTPLHVFPINTVTHKVLCHAGTTFGAWYERME